MDHTRLVGFGLALVVLHLDLLLKLFYRLLRLGLECLVSLAFRGGVIQSLLGLSWVDLLEPVVLPRYFDTAVVNVTVHFLTSVTTHGIALIQKLDGLFGCI